MNQRSTIGPTADEKNNWVCDSSEYNNRYQTFSRDAQINAKPAAVKKLDNRDTFRTGEDMANKSSYMNDYHEKETTLSQRVKRKIGPSSIAAGPGHKMECNSSYKSCFDKKDAKPAKPIRPPPPQGLGWKNNKDNGITSVSMRSYIPYTSSEIQASQRTPLKIMPEYGSIDTNPNTKPGMHFQTTVQKNFVKHQGLFRPAPAPGAIKTPAHGIAGIAGADINAKMDLTTTHKEVFDTKKSNSIDDEAVPPLVKDKSAKTPRWYKSTDNESDNRVSEISTQMYDYIHHSGVRRPKSFKPLMKYHQPETKFETKTLYKNAFTEHGNQRRKPMIPAARTKDDEVIRHIANNEGVYDTEYNRTFLQAPDKFDRPRAIIPKNSNRTSGKFYDKTSYSCNYDCEGDRSIARMPSFRPKTISDPWHKSDDTSDQFKSTTREHFKGVFAKPANICRPKIKKENGIGNVTRQVHFDTEYSNCFKEQQASS